jgi:hypothetical protein
LEVISNSYRRFWHHDTVTGINRIDRVSIRDLQDRPGRRKQNARIGRPQGPAVGLPSVRPVRATIV